MTRPRDYYVRHEPGSDRLTVEQARGALRLPVYAILDRIRSAHNVGSMFRTADGAGLAGMVLCGYTPTPPHRHLAKTALGAVDVVPWRHCETTAGAIKLVRQADCFGADGVCARAVGAAQVIALEATESSVPLYGFELRFPLAVVVGNEVDGLGRETTDLCDATVHLPMHGLKSSLNVSVAFGIALYEIARSYKNLPPAIAAD